MEKKVDRSSSIVDDLALLAWQMGNMGSGEKFEWRMKKKKTRV